MAVGEGKFVLYSRVEPPLEAGDYRFRVTQDLTASGPDGPLDSADLPVDELATHVRVRSPRFALPPDQVLSTFPPAGSEGAYGSRLPQVVIRRRTLPWERLVAPGRRGTPWLALVLIAEGEAELKLNQPVADCVTPGRTLPGLADTELGNYLQIRKSVVDRVFPTQLDVPLLAHAREVDIHDTELLMGDDDGFLAVVISNRLPLPGRDAAGEPAPVTYLACLVNLEGQFDELLPEAPEPAPFTLHPARVLTESVTLAEWDNVAMGRPVTSAPVEGLPKAAGAAAVTKVAGTPGTAPAPYEGAATWSTATTGARVADVYAEMARPFGHAYVSGFVAGDLLEIDRTLRFPVLLHWSFTSAGSTTFRTLMEGLDSGLLGTLPEQADPSGREPLEVVETGHTGLAHRTRRGDPVRCWYRGPFVAHPTADPPGGRLPLAHAADQVRIVVPDGREDLSVAAAFEIGRLLALSRPSMIAALLRWRQTGYETARRGVVWDQFASFLDEVLGDAADVRVDGRIGVRLGRGLAGAVATRPEEFLGDPRPLVDPGRPLPLDGATERLIADGFGLPGEVLRGEPAAVLRRLRDTEVRRPLLDVTAPPPPGVLRAALTASLDREVGRLVADTLAPRRGVPVVGPGGGVPHAAKAVPGQPDALDRLLDRLAGPGGAPDGEGEEEEP